MNRREFLFAAAAATLARPQPVKAARRRPALALGAMADLPSLGPAGQDAELAKLLAMGTKRIRLTLDWARIEPGGKGVYDVDHLARIDRAVSLLQGAGIQILGLLLATPQWARSGPSVFDQAGRQSDWTDFVAFISRRYARRIAAYQVWNEQNTLRFWPDGPDPAAYVRLLKATHPVIKAADPYATVVFGGLAMGNTTRKYLSDCYAGRPQRFFDVMACHLYGYGMPPTHYELDVDGTIAYDWFLGYRTLRGDMAARGDAKPLWVTEFGWSTSTVAADWANPVTEAEQAANFRSAIALLRATSYVQSAMVYMLTDTWYDDRDTLENRFGVLRADRSEKPAFAVLQAASL